ncbi:MAG: fumarylacetoacetate hydrolase family protein [Tunicatimonas sp.]
MKAYRTTSGIVIHHDDQYYINHEADWDTLMNQPKLFQALEQSLPRWEQADDGEALIKNQLLPPIGQQEVWAAGVTYYRSRDARMEESKESGGGSFYDRVYEADRPELFMKSTPARVVGHRQPVRIRRDSSWNVPEPELTLLVASSGEIIGYTVGNDMSSRSIEGENPLYLPQAKSYDGSAALGPGVLVTSDPFPRDARISLRIERGGKVMFDESTTVDQIKRSFDGLVEYLYRECSFPHGCYLMTGTGIIPENDFTLQQGDTVSITIEGIGTLVNGVA